MTKVKNIGSNQTEIHKADGAVILVSYSTPVAAQLAGGGFVRTAEKFSNTTTRHINKWLSGINAEEVPQSQLDSML